MKNKNPAYSVLVVTSVGAVMRRYRVVAEGDEEAIELAQREHRQPEHGLELWKGNKLVYELAAADQKAVPT